ncbi:MAG: DNA-3-methyladenine glycosylase [Balneolaceae bacterium]|nr:MAG: DNA-3-methyladenine glycosylase [Balneolaceae bacterium]
MSSLPRSFYETDDVVSIARSLIGKVLMHEHSDGITSGMIIETEAYSGTNDKACHACNGRRTARTEVMYGEPGHSYIYLCYGIHHLFNVVTNRAGRADAVLIRALWPLKGMDIMQIRRGTRNLTGLCDGPGKLTQALAITTNLNGLSLTGGALRIEDQGFQTDQNAILQTPRIGIDYAEEDAALPWRFLISKPERSVSHPHRLLPDH